MKISQTKKDKVSEQILLFLYRSFPKSPFTAEIAREIARDEEFVKNLMFDLKQKELVVSVRKNSEGVSFSRRIKWRLSNRVYDLYKQKQV
jgi:hypothetical protein